MTAGCKKVTMGEYDFLDTKSMLWKVATRAAARLHVALEKTSIFGGGEVVEWKYPNRKLEFKISLKRAITLAITRLVHNATRDARVH